MTEPQRVRRPAAIEVRDVCFGYESQEVLHNVNLEVEQRALVGVVGPNGGGKTTLLRLMLGLLTPRLGTVRVFGEEPERVRRRIGYVPQHLSFDPQFPVSVLDVVLMGRVERHPVGPYRRGDRAAALAALEQVGLADLARRPFAGLSGGERQRVVIAQALATEPDLLMLDEPTASVDTLAEHRIYELLRELNERLTIVLVSHNLNVVTAYVSHIICVNRTAAIDPAGSVTDAVFREAYGGDMSILRHHPHCRVINPHESVHTPHQAEAPAKGPRP